jgi:hypothetical protein
MVCELVVGPCVGLLGTFLVLLFPNGRLLTRRWRPVAWFSGAVLILLTLSLAFSPGPLTGTPNVINPIGIEPAGSALEVVSTVADALLSLCFVASAASMFVRFRRSVGEEPQQLKWFVSAAALLAISFPILTPFTLGLLEDVVTLIFAGLPIAVGIAILRYRLYNIDSIINRALVYGALTVMLAGVYLCCVVVLQYLFRALTGGGRLPAGRRCLHARRRCPVQPLQATRSGVHRPSLLPQQVRREEDPPRFLDEATRRDGPGGVEGRPRRGGSGDDAACSRLAVVTPRHGSERQAGRLARSYSPTFGEGKISERFMQHFA